MMRLNAARVGIQQGSRVLFSDFADNGPMWTGTGPRESRSAIRFATLFAEAPAVMVAISMWDMDRGTNARADLSAENVTPRGFDLVFRTWGDTRVARLRADWTAIGPVLDDDLWDV